MKNTDFATFLSVPTCQRPIRHDLPEATATAERAAQLETVLCVSRFVHYLKVLTRDMAGSVPNAKDCEARLNDWLRNYVSQDADPSDPVSAQHPLSFAEVELREIPGRPGSPQAVLLIKPAFQLQGWDRPLRTVFELPASKS